MLQSVGGLPYLCDREKSVNAHSWLVFPPPVQLPHRLPGFWLPDPVFGPGHQGHSGVPGSQAERSEHLTSKQEDRLTKLVDCTSSLLSYISQ